MLKLFASTLICLILAGCGAGPDSLTLTQHLQQQLNQQFGDDRLTLVSLQRRGSQPASIEAQDGHIVYFKAALKLQHAAQWSAQQQQRLSQLLSTGDNGIELDNDKIFVNGLSWNVWQDGQWRIKTLKSEGESRAPDAGRETPGANCSPQ